MFTQQTLTMFLQLLIVADFCVSQELETRRTDNPFLKPVSLASGHHGETRVPAKYTDTPHQKALLSALTLYTLSYDLSDATLDRSGEEQADGHHFASQKRCCQPQSAGGFRRVGYGDGSCALCFQCNLHSAI